MWNDDIRRFGMIALATDMTMEGDARLVMPEGTRLHVTRIEFDNPTTEENLRNTGPRLRAAVDLIVPGVHLDGIGFGCTSAAAVLGDQMDALAGGRAHVTTPAGAALRGFAVLDVTRVALMTPYLEATTNLVGDYFEAHGIDVVRRVSMNFPDDRDMAVLPPDRIIDMALDSDHPDAQALFISCTALPVMTLIPEIEERLGKPVISSNQALFWSMLDQARIPATGPGTLFGLRTW
ncbi:ectoine utilization protein EutA [Paracoccus sp. 1_MG-2023]|uniref:maleate cis-trans isomerase family protein n=1 Tax=unclassified Paracoccus (in: a-proteobacteria) TaxID=2688777 RepID=UPI001C09D99A|nr:MULTISPECIES: ectoine utilization protein EutA [unclassified Paracoccus (in: a-proteobacteria)]MBU2958612.1 ectoine utilization protein EutA [Paracoccus sp. C2R09]MDO6667605.1 ectoine utilization protein EutA [Paracoccus sp. 1_MG-2023]